MTSRLNVNVTDPTRAALDRYVARHGVTLTEAVRRLVAIGDIIYQATQIDGAELLVRRGDRVEEMRIV